MPTASFNFPPFELIISTYLADTLEAPCKTIGNSGSLLETSSRISNLSCGFVPGLNLNAP